MKNRLSFLVLFIVLLIGTTHGNFEVFAQSKKENGLKDYIGTNHELGMAIANRKNGYKIIQRWGDFSVLTSRGRFQKTIRRLKKNTIIEDYLYFNLETQNGADILWASVYFSEDEYFKNYFFCDVTPMLLKEEKELIINKKLFEKGKGNPSWEKVK